MLLSVFHDEVWLPSCANLRECTMVGYESAWQCHIVDAFGGLEIDSITADMIETWMAGMPRGAARKAWGVLRTMLRKAFRWGVSSVDVTTRVRGPKRTDHQPHVLDARQISALLRGFWGHELEAWLICSVTLGLRPEEALGLEWSDIDLRGGLVRIRRGVQWVSGHEVVVEPKTDLSARDVVLPRFAIIRLRQIRGRGDGRLVGGLNPGQVDRRYRRWCREQHLPFVPRENLRHSWATSALVAGVDVAVVSRALGHSSIETTARYYLRPDTSVLKDAQRLWEKSIMR
ncbi:site-specific integrase [Bifidobacterium adolescentis]|uniref:tyrosine-type recombinase/integrase n=1 Tax=Bifidobacterium adolescentis TaxID=1680 RepID=UPI0018DB3269|nr:site-specific integrase [Bifidobacterium adolescentis]MBH8620743.1 site-specific integrase [Bifidobacterium adolescentis]